jgi:hemoglobin
VKTPATRPAAASLHERLGGTDAIAAVVESFYERVLGDPELRPFFDGVPMDVLRGSQTRFLVQALGGPSEYRGPSMREVHARMRITDRQFALVEGHLGAALAAAGASPAVIDEVVAVVAPLAADIVSQ